MKGGGTGAHHRQGLRNESTRFTPPDNQDSEASLCNNIYINLRTRYPRLEKSKPALFSPIITLSFSKYQRTF